MKQVLGMTEGLIHIELEFYQSDVKFAHQVH